MEGSARVAVVGISGVEVDREEEVGSVVVVSGMAVVVVSGMVVVEGSGGTTVVEAVVISVVVVVPMVDISSVSRSRLRRECWHR